MPQTTVKTYVRISLRIKPEDKSIIEKAAAIEGVSVTEFVIRAAVTEARRVLKENSQSN